MTSKKSYNELKYSLFRAAGRCCDAAEKYGKNSEQYKKACEERNKIRAELLKEATSMGRC